MKSRIHFSSASAHWPTPRKTFEALNAEFKFNLDPCPLGAKHDGLAVAWRGKRVFCNPPYGPGIRKWLERGLEAKLAVFLLPARTDTAWFHEIVMPKAREIRFLRGRLNFGDGRPEQRAPFPSIVVVFERGSESTGFSRGI